MKKNISSFCFLLLALSTPCLAQERRIEDSQLTSALGNVKRTQNAKKATVYDFSRKGLDLRLEDIVTKGIQAAKGPVISGSFTLTRLFRAPGGGILKEKSEHLYATYTAESGVLMMTLGNGKDGSPGILLLQAGALAPEAPPPLAANGAAFLKRAEAVCEGDAAQAMASVIGALSDRLATISKTKLP